MEWFVIFVATVAHLVVTFFEPLLWAFKGFVWLYKYFDPNNLPEKFELEENQ